MTSTELKVKEALLLLGISIDHKVDQQELKKAYLKSARLYHPDTCKDPSFKDGKMFAKVKESYDYLNNDINMTNECINNILHPESSTYNYSSQYDNNGFSGYNSQYNNFYRAYSTENIEIKDNVSLLLLIMSFFIPLAGILLYKVTRRVTPKSSIVYLLTSILGIVLIFGSMIFRIFMWR